MTDNFLVELILGCELIRRLDPVSNRSYRYRDVLTYFFHAALCGSGMLASTLLISAGPKPVTVRLCFGLLIPAGPMGPLRSEMGADELGLRSRAGASVLEAMLEGEIHGLMCV